MINLMWSFTTRTATVLAILGIGSTHVASAQRTFVREFQTGAVLLTNGDTVQGRILVHYNQDVLEFRRQGQPSQLIPATMVQRFAVAQEITQQDGFVLPRALTPEEYSQQRLSKQLPTTPHFNSLVTQPRRFTSPGTEPIGQFPVVPTTDTPYLNQINSLGQTEVLTKGPDQIAVYQTYRYGHGLVGGLGAPAFFEPLIKGPIELLSRQELYAQPHEVLYVAQVKSDEVMATAVRLRKPRKQLYDLYAEYKSELNHYRRANRLKFSATQDIVELVTYGNKLLTVAK